MLTITRATVTEEIVSEKLSRFIFEPLEPGFGYTIGNSLRRTLLASVPGAAITSIKVDGVLHEFTTVAGVSEDITQVVLNLKEVVVAFEGEEPEASLRLQAKGAGIVTAKSIELPTGVTILNPDAPIATLNAKGKLDIEMTVERGSGYQVADRMKRKDAIGVLPIDAIFSPVRRVTYTVEHTRVEQMTNYDKLIVEVETDGSIAPVDAVVVASRHLGKLIKRFAELVEEPAEEIVEAAPRPLIDSERPVEQLDLSIRALNCLKRNQVNTLGELLECTPEDLRSLRNFGEKSIEEVVAKLDEMGLTLAERII